MKIQLYSTLYNQTVTQKNLTLLKILPFVESTFEAAGADLEL